MSGRRCRAVAALAAKRVSLRVGPTYGRTPTHAGMAERELAEMGRREYLTGCRAAGFVLRWGARGPWQETAPGTAPFDEKLELMREKRAKARSNKGGHAARQREFRRRIRALAPVEVVS
jgi:hypothetical protein